MRKIFLYGRLRKEFGPVFELEVRTAGEARRRASRASYSPRGASGPQERLSGSVSARV